MKTIYAVLVGINNYPAPYALHGCINDCLSVYAFLQSLCASNGMQLQAKLLLAPHAKDEPAIKSASINTYEAPTRHAVIGSFSHFDGANAAKGDICFFYYSGHGSHQLAPKAFWHMKSSRQNESIVCVDSLDDNGKVLLDKELAYLLWKSAQNLYKNASPQGSNLIVMMDCCHSGSNTRSGEQTTTLARQCVADRNISELHEYLGYETGFYKHLGGGKYNIQDGRYIHLAAARDSETAKETQIEGKRQGIFTYTLLKTLEDGGVTYSYRELLDRVEVLVRNRIDEQIPQAEATEESDLSQLFFGGELRTPKKTYYVSYNQLTKQWILNAGSIHGIAKRDHQGKATEITLEDGRTTTLVQVGTAESQVEGSIFTQEDANKANLLYSATVNSSAFAPMLVNLDMLPSNMAEDLKSETKNSLIVFTNAADATHEAKALEGGYVLTLKDNNVPLFIKKDSAPEFLEAMEGVAKWQRLLEWNNPNTYLHAGDIDISVDVIEGIPLTADNLDKLTSGKPMLSNPQKISAQYVNDKQPAIKVRIKSRNRALHVCAIYLGKKYSIKQYLSGKTTQINKTGEGEWIRFPLEDKANGGYKYADTIPLVFDKTFHTYGWSEIEDYIKVFISTSPFDMKRFEQPEMMLQKGLATREAGFESREADAPMDNDWYSITLPIKIVRPLPNAGATISEQQPARMLGAKIMAPKGFSANLNMASRATIMQTKSGESLGKTSRNASFSPEQIDLQRALFPPTAMWGDSLAGGSVMSRAAYGVPNTDQQIHVMELNEVEGQLSPEQPMLVIPPEPLVAGETIIPFAYDPDTDFYVPIGFTDAEGTVHIEQLPEATPGRLFDDESAINKRSIGSSLKILFEKVKSKFTGDKEQSYNALAWCERDSDGIIRKTVNPEGGLEQKKNIILVIHGIIGDTEGQVNAVFYHTHLHEQFDAVLSYDYENLNTDLRETGKDLKKKLEKAGIFDQPEQKLTIVAHSMGGLVSRWFIEHEGGDAVVKKLVQVGTPNAGSEIADFKDSLFSLLSWAMNGAVFLKPYIGVLSFMGRFADKNICFTLMQMSPTKSDFLPELNSNAKQKPATEYRLIIGNTNMMSPHTHPNDSFWVKVMENIKQNGKYTLANRLIFKRDKDNDIAVTVTSASSVPWLLPSNIQVVECDHMSYFTHLAGLRALEEVLA